MRYVRKSIKNPVSNVQNHHDTPVQNNLAYTPSDMLKMAQNGIPVSSVALQDDCVDFGNTSRSFDVPLEHQRGMDPARLWMESQDIKKRFRDSVNRDKSIKSE